MSHLEMQTVYNGIVSFTVGCLFILKMIYQIDFFPQGDYDVNCSTVRFPINIANWIGLQKVADGESMAHHLKSYIIFIVVLCVYNLILMHRKRIRFVYLSFLSKYFQKKSILI